MANAYEKAVEYGRTDIAKKAYDAYCVVVDDDMPSFDDAPVKIKAAWVAASRTVFEIAEMELY